MYQFILQLKIIKCVNVFKFLDSAQNKKQPRLVAFCFGGDGGVLPFPMNGNPSARFLAECAQNLII